MELALSIEVRGMYIVLEGGEHTGKSTQVEILARAIGGISVREPGGTQIGNDIRSLLLSTDIEKTPKTQVLLHAAQRAELISEVINPTLKSGRHVVSDRSWISSAAYQGGLEVDLKDIEMINRYAVGERFSPDLLIVLDADPNKIASRATEGGDYYENLSNEYHQNIRHNFISLATRMNGVIIDAVQSVEDVSEQIYAVVHERLGIKRR